MMNVGGIVYGSKCGSLMDGPPLRRGRISNAAGKDGYITSLLFDEGEGRGTKMRWSRGIDELRERKKSPLKNMAVVCLCRRRQKMFH